MNKDLAARAEDGLALHPGRAKLAVAPVDLFLVLGFFFLSCNVVEKFLRPAGLDNAFYLALYLTSACLFMYLGFWRRIVFIAPLLCMTIAMPLISIAWSVDPRVTAFRSAELAGSSLFGVVAGLYLPSDRLLSLLFPALLMMVVGSLLVIVLLPAYGIAEDNAWRGTWIGLSLHKNGLGGAASIALLVFTYAIFVVRWRLPVLAAWLLSALLLVGSRSATSQLVTLIGLGLGFAILLYQYRPQFGMLLGFLVLLALPAVLWGFLAFDVGTTLVAMMGKDTTLGSRIGIWKLVWPYIQDRYWLGYGYGAFWQTHLPWVHQVTARLNFEPHYSHNGLVELWLGGGALLVIVTVLAYLAAFARSIVPMILERHRAQSAFACVFLATFSFRNVTEAAALMRNDINWVLFVAVAVSLARDVRFRPPGAPR